MAANPLQALKPPSNLGNRRDDAVENAPSEGNPKTPAVNRSANSSETFCFKPSRGNLLVRKTIATNNKIRANRISN
ncbi:hypothetical protein AUJ65_04650 [Candidatus Micrarchaeota archaeon CG1_02_51_15]|nr:MAG: hypothetical protein AUJ65_04650 [Candidatus Micrarchaeota archaeon CG1_02_51_15]